MVLGYGSPRNWIYNRFCAGSLCCCAAVPSKPKPRGTFSVSSISLLKNFNLNCDCWHALFWFFELNFQYNTYFEIRKRNQYHFLKDHYENRECNTHLKLSQVEKKSTKRSIKHTTLESGFEGKRCFCEAITVPVPAAWDLPVTLSHQH